MSLNYSELELQLLDLKKALIGKHISRIILLSKNVYSFSITKTDNVVISLCNNFPLIHVYKFDENFTSCSDSHIQFLKKQISNALIEDIELFNKNRIYKIKLKTVNDIFKEETKYLICELIPNKANLILLNEEEKIEFVLKTSGNNRILLNGCKYEEPVAQNFNPIPVDCYPNLDCQIETILNDRKKEKFKDIFEFINRKYKISKNKIEKINEDIENAKSHLNDGDYGNLILMNLPSIEYKQKSLIIDDITIRLDPKLKPAENANLYFKKAKKARITIQQGKLNLKRAEDDYKQAELILNLFKISSESECENLIKEFDIKTSKSKENNDQNLISSSFKPYKFDFNGTSVLFGKNAKQNDYLTFVEDTTKNHIWMHIIGVSGSHLMIKNPDPSNELINICAELLCYASKQVDGQVMLTKRENVKKGQVPGQVNIKSFKTIRVNNISEKAVTFYNNAVKI